MHYFLKSEVSRLKIAQVAQVFQYWGIETDVKEISEDWFQRLDVEVITTDPAVN
jgi:hypothetical protein